MKWTIKSAFLSQSSGLMLVLVNQKGRYFVIPFAQKDLLNDMISSQELISFAESYLAGGGFSGRVNYS